MPQCYAPSPQQDPPTSPAPEPQSPPAPESLQEVPPRGAGQRHTQLVVVPRSAELEAAERDLGRALVAVIAGTRPPVSLAMVRAFLAAEFGIEDASVHRYEPEDFVVRFANRDDAERVLHSRVLNPPFRLIWHPWSRLSTASSTFLRYCILVGMTRVPLHARSAAVAQTILGRACARIEIAPPEAVPVDDDREFFVSAWCMDPRFVPDEQIIFIHEPVHRIPGTVLCLRADEEVIDGLPGLNYLVRIRIVEFQDWSTPRRHLMMDMGDVIRMMTMTTLRTATITAATPVRTWMAATPGDPARSGVLTLLTLHFWVDAVVPLLCHAGW